MRLKYYLAICVLILALILAGCGTVPTTATNNPQSSATFSPNPSSITTNPIPSQAITIPVNSSTTKLEVYFLDVGQGDSEILRNGNSAMLIDAGTNASTNTLINDITGLGISRFDVVVATHPHEDHIGGLEAVINQFGMGTIYMPKVANNTQTFADVLQAIKNKGLTITTPISGSRFSFGSDTCTILAPNSQSYSDLNNYSIVIRVVNGNNSFLFTGDAQIESENEILAKGYNLDSDVLKVGHHGSNTATSSDFLKAVSPKYAVIEVGKDNQYGLPHQATLDKLNNSGVQVYRTDVNGIVEIDSDGNSLTVPTETTINPAITTPSTSVLPSTQTQTTVRSTTPIESTVVDTTSELAFDILSLTSPVKPGANATLAAKTVPGAQCDITFYTKSGASSAAGLYPKVADSTGSVSWTWKIGTRTTPGTWSIVIKVSNDGKSVTKTVSITVQ